MTINSRDQLPSTLPSTIKSVEIRELGCSFFIRPVSMKSVIKMREITGDDENECLHMFRLIVRSVCDQSGKLIFTDADIPVLSELPFWAARRLFYEVAQLSGLRLPEDETVTD